MSPPGWSISVDSNHDRLGQEPGMLRRQYRGMEPPRGIEPRPRPYQGRMLPLSPWRRGASGRIRTGHHQLGRLRSCRWTTLASVAASVVKDPALASWWAARTGFNRFEDTTSLQPGPRFPAGPWPTKKAF